MGARGSLPRVAVFTKALDNWTSGSGHHLQEILSAALDQNDGRFDFTFVHYTPSENPIYRRARELLVARNPLRAAAVLRAQRFDIVHYAPLTIYSPLWGVPGKKVATMHGAEQLLLPKYHGKLELAHEYFLVPAYARRMDRIVTVSETSADFFVKHFRIQRDRIVICYNGLSDDYGLFRPEEVTAPERYGVRRPFILHVSRLSERKNPCALLDAFAHFIREHDRPHSLVCAGSGWNGDGILERVRALGFAERYVAPGFVPVRDIAELMNASDAFVFPSLAEGFGMPNIEAMACGSPVVTTPAFAVREIVGDAALVVEDPADSVALSSALSRVVSDGELRRTLIERGRDRLPLFSWTKSAQRLLRAYEELVGR